MTREEIKGLLPLLQAYADGKALQYYYTGEWIDLKEGEDLSLVNYPKKYRIKPSPTYRPFANAEECWQEMKKHEPFGWVKAIPDEEYILKYYPNEAKSVDLYYHIQKVAPGYIKYDDNNDFCEIGGDKPYKDTFEVIVFADGAPFGVKVEEE